MKHLRYPLVCFDLDGTLVDDTVYIWKTLHDHFATDAEARQRAYDDYFGRRITYSEWFAHDLELLGRAGATDARIRELLDGLRPMHGAEELLAGLRAKGHTLAIISGSLDVVVDHIFGLDLFDHVLINRIEFDPSGNLSGGTPTEYDIEAKAEGLRYLAQKEGLSLSRTAFVGDNENDVWIAKEAGLSIAFNCKSDKLRRVAHHEITEKDLRLVEPLLV